MKYCLHHVRETLGCAKCPDDHPRIVYTQQKLYKIEMFNVGRCSNCGKKRKESSFKRFCKRCGKKETERVTRYWARKRAEGIKPKQSYKYGGPRPDRGAWKPKRPGPVPRVEMYGDEVLEESPVGQD